MKRTLNPEPTNWTEEDSVPCDLHQSFDDVDNDTGLAQDEAVIEVDPLDVEEERETDEDVIEDPAPVDDSLVLFEQIGEVIDNDWTQTVTNNNMLFLTLFPPITTPPFKNCTNKYCSLSANKHMFFPLSTSQFPTSYVDHPIVIKSLVWRNIITEKVKLLLTLYGPLPPPPFFT